MNFRKKRLQWLHLCYAICDSATIVFLCCMSILVMCCLLSLPCLSDSVQFTAFFVGIAASIIATAIIKVGEKYSESCRAYNRILLEINLLNEYIKNNILPDEVKNYRQHRFVVYQFKGRIQVEAEKLTYEQDYKRLFGSIKEVMDAVYNHPQKLRQASEGLERLMKEVTSE